MKHEFKKGDLVLFPDEYNSYTTQVGVFVGQRDNPSDVNQINGGSTWAYLQDGPRQLADIFHNGRLKCAWLTSCRKPQMEK